jgi:hypothetical protein
VRPQNPIPLATPHPYGAPSVREMV